MVLLALALLVCFAPVVGMFVYGGMRHHGWTFAPKSAPRPLRTPKDPVVAMVTRTIADMRVSRERYLAMEQEAMDHWEKLCQCPSQEMRDAEIARKVRRTQQQLQQAADDAKWQQNPVNIQPRGTRQTIVPPMSYVEFRDSLNIRAGHPMEEEAMKAYGAYLRHESVVRLYR